MSNRENPFEFREISPAEKIYPLNFACHYVMRKRDELSQLEAQSIQDILNILRNSEKILQLSEQIYQAGASRKKTDVQQIYEMHKALNKEIKELSIRMTEKGFVFENMTNMLQQTNPLIARLIFFDTLTVAYNRYFFISHADKMFRESQKRMGLSIGFMDIDNFKQFNAEYGHDFGDQVLQQLGKVAEMLIENHPATYLIRMGGDEFIILNNGTLNYTEFCELLESIRQQAAQLIVNQGTVSSLLSISIGAANAQIENVDNYLELYRLADERLYRAKDAGKNVLITQDADDAGPDRSTPVDESDHDK